MSDATGDQKTSRVSDPKDHLANERTFLAWIRMSIGIMAFGFVVEKFGIFVKQFALLLGNTQLQSQPPPSFHLQGYSSIFGVSLVAFGALICLLAFIKYKNVEKQIDNRSYQPSMLLNVLLTITVILIGIFLIFYLKYSI